MNDNCFNGVNGDGVVKRDDSMITSNLNLSYKMTEDLDVIMQIVNLTDEKVLLIKHYQIVLRS
ncbi:hypothetical protein [Pleionea sediminis]|uniref:hypothetical protein n=1 Tax=Pleionea sediminis TaxID=2569479 RepID=UPI001184E1ED|nr:hypothetical protein [Pleionea sediminis]